MSIFSDDTDPALHGSTLFGPMDGANKPHDPWSALATSSDGTSVSRMLINTIVPEIYSKSFELASPIDGVVDASELVKILEAAKLTSAQIDSVVTTIQSPATIDRGTWNVAMALAGFVQRGTKDLNLHMVDFSKNSLPNVKIPGLSETIVESSGPWNDNSIINTPEDSLQPPLDNDANEIWQSSFDPSLYTPVSKNTISISVAPKREGTFLFRHVNYIVEGTLPTIRDGGATSFQKPRFKVIRRYSDFVWLLESLQKKYPFRLLPILRNEPLEVNSHGN
ncbi:hypothetical protein D0Z00_000675 [Geotrichum galactomycetum]|uniref:Uncharacterized protein n=1 Tax=Geotrichum galactomycetum TaxID=27317 RepID=A0ACB6V968_9ASCO|nr:hypothetical protein D0Z00_000675 [Geotrichum candidum]